MDTIGQGGEATVYRCQDPNGAQYALKAFDFSRYSRKKATERIQNFHKETRMLKYLAGRSPHFVRLYDSEYNPTTNTGYMVMELGESSLRDHLIGAPLNDSIRKTCWRQIVAILTTLQDSHVGNELSKQILTFIDCLFSSTSKFMLTSNLKILS